MRNILITGASTGIGRALAVKAAANGDRVWGVARNGEALARLEEETAGGARTSVCDIADPAAVVRTLEKMSEAGFQPDLVYLNAAVDLEDPYPELPVENLRQTFRTNLEGALSWVSHCLPGMLDSGGGEFVAVSSLLAFRPDPASPAYAASKAGLSMAFRSLRQRYRGTGVRFRTVYLGPVATGINPRFREAAEAGHRPKPWIPSAAATADYLMRVPDSRGDTFHFPALVLIPCRLLSWMPDTMFEILTRKLRR